MRLMLHPVRATSPRRCDPAAMPSGIPMWPINLISRYSLHVELPLAYRTNLQITTSKKLESFDLR